MLYTNKIHLESKKFDDIINAHTLKMQAKLAGKAGETPAVEQEVPQQEETPVQDNTTENINETTVSEPEAKNVDTNATEKDK